MDEIIFSNEGDEIIIKVIAKSFLHSQVRIIIGTIVKIGDKTWEPEKIKSILSGKDRSLAGPTAPADGLYLENMRIPYSLIR